MIRKSTSLFWLAITPFALHHSLSSTSTLDHAEQVFTEIFEQNKWFSRETASGHGSEVAITKQIRPKISSLVKLLNITSIADAPCGDFNWMKLVDLGECRYLGIDIVKALIDRNTSMYANPLRSFKHLNVIETAIEKVDLILCRDLLAHLTYADIFEVLHNFKKSGSKYLLVTTNNRVSQNNDIPETGGWRLLNLQEAPFNFPKPIAMIEEDVPYECERGKHLGLWRLQDINLD